MRKRTGVTKRPPPQVLLALLQAAQACRTAIDEKKIHSSKHLGRVFLCTLSSFVYYVRKSLTLILRRKRNLLRQVDTFFSP